MYPQGTPVVLGVYQGLRDDDIKKTEGQLTIGNGVRETNLDARQLTAGVWIESKGTPGKSTAFARPLGPFRGKWNCILFLDAYINVHVI